MVLDADGELFESSTDNIGRHLKNIFSDNELKEAATTEDFSVVQAEGRRKVRRHVKHYNPDAIISVGYRVNSHRGVRFRQWATSTLREHLVRGYTLNRQRLEENAREPESALTLVRQAAADEALPGNQGRGLVDIIGRYTQTFLLLQRYDSGLLVEPQGMRAAPCPATSGGSRSPPWCRSSDRVANSSTATTCGTAGSIGSSSRT